MQAYQLSYWEWSSFFRDLDVIVIGSGIVGLSAAIQLKTQAPKLRIVVLDRGPLPIGASTRNAGFACFGSLSELEDDLTHSSRDEVLSLVEARYRGLQQLRAHYGDQALGYEPLGGYELFRETDIALYDHCRNTLADWNRDLASITGNRETYQLANGQLPNMRFKGVQHLILNQAEGQLDTGKLIQTLLQRAQALQIVCLGGISVSSLESHAFGIELHTSHGWVLQARQALVATNGFAHQLLPKLAVTPARNQVLITSPLPDLPFKGSFHYDRGYVYFRNVGQRILIGGGRNIAPTDEETTSLAQTKEIQDYLLQLLHDVIAPVQPIQVERWWSGIMGVGDIKQPIIRELTPQIIVAVRLGGMGVALGTIVGEQAAKLLLG